MKKSLFFLLLFYTTFAKAQVAPSLLLFHTWDFAVCEERMSRLMAMGFRNINIVPTIKFIYNQKKEPKSFCHQKNRCLDFNDELIDEIEGQLRSCAQVAAEAGANLSFIPHIDDGEGRGLWRNDFVFDPLVKHKGFSYKEVILDPILRIIQGLEGQVKVDFSFQGEMGATVFNYPDSYAKIYDEYKEKLREKAELGISLNFNKLGGKGFRSTSELRRQMQRLLSKVDFLGMSAYHPIEVVMDEHFEFSVMKFKYELKRMRLKLPKGLPLHFSEIGLGGGTRRNDGKTSAKELSEIKAAPYAGIYGAYNLENDPWSVPGARQLRRSFYSELLSFIGRSRENPVTKAFIWNADSWDVFGIYPRTSGYKDDQVLNQVLERCRSCSRP